MCRLNRGARAKVIFRAGAGAVVIAEGVIKLDDAKEFIQAYRPVLRRVVGGIGRATLRTGSGEIAIFRGTRVFRTPVAQRIVELDGAQELIKIDDVVDVGVRRIDRGAEGERRLQLAHAQAGVIVLVKLLEDFSGAFFFAFRHLGVEEVEDCANSFLC